MKELHDYFTIWDWAVVIGYLAITTWVGHRMRGQQATIKDFFLGGRSLPWPAVSGSIIATEISGVTFIGVPGALFAMNGNFMYLQWAIGAILARLIVAFFFVRVYYENEIYSPYDYMGLRLGSAAKKLTTILFTVGSILGQSVRVLIAAIPLEIVTGLPLWACILAIGLFAIGWTLMGGMRTVIWTDVMQFFLFLIGGLIALFAIILSLDGGWSEYNSVGSEFDRFLFLDTGWETHLQFTLWIAIFAVPFQNLGIFGTDQLMAQRMFCCRDSKAASKAIVLSCSSQLITLLMLMVGAALFVHYNSSPFNDLELEKLLEVKGTTESEVATNLESAKEGAKVITSSSGDPSNVVAPKKTDYVFPIWIVTQLPPGLSGLILAAIFAAAISSLDSILAALSQTTLSLMYSPEKEGPLDLTEEQLLRRSRQLVIMWGILLTLFTFVLEKARGNIPILPLAFGMTTYTVGPILAIFFCALLGRGSMRGLTIGAAISFILVMFVRMDVWVLVREAGYSIDWLTSLPTYKFGDDGKVTWTFIYAWMWPITTFITLGCGLIVPRRAQNLT